MGMQTSIILIQSQVVHGHVGNSASVLPMQMCGLNVAAVPTTLLSNHPATRPCAAVCWSRSWSAICFEESKSVA